MIKDGLDKLLAVALVVIAAEHDRYVEAVAKVQKECEHPFVVEATMEGGHILRICQKCRKEEHTKWSFPGTTTLSSVPEGGPLENTAKPTTLNSDFVKHVDLSTFWKYRLGWV